MYKEEAAFLLADYFIKEYKKFDFKFPNINTIKQTKWWIHFERASEFRYLKDWNPYIWVKCQFDKYGKILPFQLYGKKAEEAFNEFKYRYINKKEQNYYQIISGMLSTYKTIKYWCKKNNIETINYYRYFEKNFDKYKRGMLSLYFLSICKPFVDNFLPKEDIEKMKIKRAVVYRNKKLVKKLKEIMKNDFY